MTGGSRVKNPPIIKACSMHMVAGMRNPTHRQGLSENSDAKNTDTHTHTERTEQNRTEQNTTLHYIKLN